MAGSSAVAIASAVFGGIGAAHALGIIGDKGGAGYAAPTITPPTPMPDPNAAAPARKRQLAAAGQVNYGRTDTVMTDTSSKLGA